MKVWETCSIEEITVAETAFGPINPESVDAEKYAVTDENGKVQGYEELYGEKEKHHS